MNCPLSFFGGISCKTFQYLSKYLYYPISKKADFKNKCDAVKIGSELRVNMLDRLI